MSEISDAQDFLKDTVNTTVAIAEQYIQKVAQNDVDIAVDIPASLNYHTWDIGSDLYASLNSIRPGFAGVSALVANDIEQITGLAVPTAPTLTIPVATMPTLDAERPVIAMPALPSTDVGAAPTDAPSITEIPAPDAPLITLPTVPTFEELQLPAAPSFSLPTFSSTAPANLLSPPTNYFSFVDQGYSSVLLNPTVAKLLNDIQNGGYGIDQTDEALLWARARDRAEQVGRTAVDAAQRQASQMSFPMPTGAYFSSMDRARKDLQDEVSKANAEIALKRADMYVDNRKFTIQQVAEFEKIATNLYNAISERALNAAKAMSDVGIAVFDASVRNYNAQLDAWKTEAQVFETRIRAELAKAELYKSQLEGERIRGEFNNQRAQLYQAQLNSVQTIANLYKTRVEAMNALTQVQAQRIEIFRARVQAYATRVQAKASEYDMYRAAVQGQTARLDIYKTDIAAYESRIRAEESRIKALTMGNDSLIDNYKARIGQYTAQLDGLNKRLDGRIAQDRNVIAATGANAVVYRAYTDAVISGINTRLEAQRLNNQWNIAAMESKIKFASQELDHLKSTLGNSVAINEYIAKFYGDRVAALSTGMNTLAVSSKTDS